MKIFLIFILTLNILTVSAFAQEKKEEGVDEMTGLSVNEILDMSLEDILSLDIATGESGSFGSQLNKMIMKTKPYINGYVVNTYREQEGKTATFDQYYFNLFIGMDIAGKLVPEIQLEYEHAGEEIQARYAQLDIILSDAFILRTGKFLVPIGVFNEYFYPEYISKLPNRPFALREIVPVSWAEVGVQLRGKYDLSNNSNLNYAVYLVNGLEGDLGGGIRDMRNNYRDKNDGNKAFGGRVGFSPKTGFEIGASGYRGAYTIDGDNSLTILDFDASYTTKAITLRGEYITATQEDNVSGDLTKSGFYIQGAYKISPYFEPVVQYDEIDLDSDPMDQKRRFTMGINVYPFPKLPVKPVFRISYEFTKNKGTDVDDNELIFLLAIGF